MRHKTPKKRPCSCLGAGDENRAHRWRRCLRCRLVGRTVCLVGARNTKLSRDACNTKLSRNDRTRACARARKTALTPRVVSVFLCGCLYHGVCRCVSHKALTKPVQHKSLKRRQCVCRRAGNENRPAPSRRVCGLFWLVVPCVWFLRATLSFQGTPAIQNSEETIVPVLERG